MVDACFHPTGTFGTFAAAVGAGKAMGLDRRQMVNAIGIAGTQAAGLLEVAGSMSKPLQVGKSAMNGLLAAMLAGEGFTGSERMFDSERGFAQALAKKDLQGITAALGSDYAILRNSYKLYPSCAATHAAIEAMLEIRQRYAVRAGRIKEISCRVDPTSIHLTGRPQVKTGLEGKFSLKFCVALALTYGEVKPDKFNESEIRNPEILALMEKIKLIEEDSYRPISEAEVAVTTDEGLEYRHTVNWVKGTPQNPVTEEDMKRKFMSLAEMAVPGEKAGQAVKMISLFEELNDNEVADLVSLCSNRATG
jgi:2-methylcitrate dehydratase PrpD